MAGAVDVFEHVQRVEVRGREYKVPGLKFRAIGRLLIRFPDLRKQLETRQFDLAALLDLSDDAIAAIIAGGLEPPKNKRRRAQKQWSANVALGDDEEREDWAGDLSLGEQAEILTRIVKATMPKGVGPFVELMEAVGVGAMLAAAPSDMVSDMTSLSEPSPSSNEDGQKTA